ncbi:cytochrome P450 [Aspergillus ambiguus]|uniref:cytochrome P450 n=1 Tax=Aspergillus ambiguus TaxID=176160 RepID=UPI003CCD71F2
MNLLVLLAVLALVASLRFFSSYVHHTRNARSWRCEPAPFYPGDILGINTLREVLRALKENDLPRLVQRRFQRMCTREGRIVPTFNVSQLRRDAMFTCDPKNIQAILITQFKDFEVGATRRSILEPYLGHGIFTSDGEEWTHSRALLRPQFTRGQISDLNLEERHVQVAMRAIPPVDSKTRWSAPVNLQTIFFRLTIDSATEFLFGESVHSQTAALTGSNGTDARFATLFDRCQELAARRVRLGWLGNSREFHHAAAFVRAYVDRYVAAALDVAHAKPTADGAEGETVFLRGLAAATQDPVEVRAQLLNILFAGRDTTASLLSFTVQQLARHPRVFAKLRAAVLDDFGAYAATDGGAPQTITFERLKACRYLQHFINEVLRLYPIVPLNRRVAARDTTLPRGGGADGAAPVYVRRGQVVTFSIFVMQRRRDLWGDDAEEFLPERWESRRAGWDYLPFGGGPRVCIGQQFALVEAAYVLVRLLQRFDGIEGVSFGTRESDPAEEIGLASNITTAPAAEVTVRLHEA